MLRDAVRGVVVGAVELAEEAGKLVRGAAEELLARTGVDVAEVERRVAEQLPPTPQSLQKLAGDAVTAGRTEIDRAVGMARGEVDRAVGAAWTEVERVFELVGDQVTKVGVVLAFLESKLREVEQEKPAERADRPEARAEGLFDAGWETEHKAEPVGAEPRKASARKAPAKKAPAQAAAKKTPAKKTTAKKTVARKTVASGGTAKRAAAKKATTKKTVVRKAATRKPAERKDTDG